MKNAVIYNSVSGFTKKYAVWISGELNAEIFKAGKFKFECLDKYDVIIYGGSLHISGISGVNKLKRNMDKIKDKKIIVFTVGASPYEEGLASDVLNKNFDVDEQKRIRFFYFRGGFDYKKLDIPNKILMTLFKWRLLLKNDKTPDEKGMLDAYENPTDFTAKENIAGLVDYAKL